MSSGGHHKNGILKFISSVFNVIRDEHGQITNILSTTRDITPEKKAQIALKDSEQRYRMLADNMSDMLMLYSPELIRLYVSPSCFKLTGYTPEEVLNLHEFTLIHPGDQTFVHSVIAGNVAAGNDDFTTEFRIVHKTGAIKYVSSTLNVIRHADGQISNILTTARDITPEKKAQIALRESEEKYRSLVEASEDIILIMNGDGKYLFANDIACKYVGRPLAEVMNSTIFDLMDADAANLYVEKIKHVLHTNKSVTFESHLSINGRQTWLRNTLQPINDAVSNAIAVMLCLVDITDLKVYTEALRAQNDELKKIAYLQSHIVRAPLANIQGLMNLLDENKLDRETGLYINLLKEAATKLDEVIKEIVDRAIEVKHRTTDV